MWRLLAFLPLCWAFGPRVSVWSGVGSSAADKVRQHLDVLEGGTVYSYCGMRVNSSGALHHSDMSQCVEAANEFHGMSLQFQPVVGTTDCEDIDAAVKHPDRFAESAVYYVGTYGFEGVQLDFEKCGMDKGVKGFLGMANATVKALAALNPPRELSIAISGLTGNYQWTDVMEQSGAFIVTMETYTEDKDRFKAALNWTLAQIPCNRVGIGLYDEESHTEDYLAWQVDYMTSTFQPGELDLFQVDSDSPPDWWWKYLGEWRNKSKGCPS